MGFERYVQTCMFAQDPCQGSNTVVPTCSQDYLETKRIAFPRFYFVSPADLLDILAKGTNPQLIVKHLSKCFDNVHNIDGVGGKNSAILIMKNSFILHRVALVPTSSAAGLDATWHT